MIENFILIPVQAYLCKETAKPKTITLDTWDPFCVFSMTQVKKKNVFLKNRYVKPRQQTHF